MKDSASAKIENQISQIILIEDYKKIKEQYNDEREALMDVDEISRNESAYDDVSLDYYSVQLALKNHEMMVVGSVESYLETRLEGENLDAVFVSGKGVIEFEQIPCSDTIEISINGNSIGAYSHDTGIDLDSEYETFEDAIEINSIGDNDVGGGEYDRDEEDFEW